MKLVLLPLVCLIIVAVFPGCNEVSLPDPSAIQINGEKHKLLSLSPSGLVVYAWSDADVNGDGELDRLLFVDTKDRNTGPLGQLQGASRHGGAYLKVLVFKKTESAWQEVWGASWGFEYADAASLQSLSASGEPFKGAPTLVEIRDVNGDRADDIVVLGSPSPCLISFSPSFEPSQVWLSEDDEPAFVDIDGDGINEVVPRPMHPYTIWRIKPDEHGIDVDPDGQYHEYDYYAWDKVAHRWRDELFTPKVCLESSLDPLDASSYQPLGVGWFWMYRVTESTGDVPFKGPYVTWHTIEPYEDRLFGIWEDNPASRVVIYVRRPEGIGTLGEWRLMDLPHDHNMLKDGYLLWLPNSATGKTQWNCSGPEIEGGVRFSLGFLPSVEVEGGVFRDVAVLTASSQEPEVRNVGTSMGELFIVGERRTITARLYYAKGVGLIKKEAQGVFGSSEASYTMELVSYQRPPVHGHKLGSISASYIETVEPDSCTISELTYQ